VNRSPSLSRRSRPSLQRLEDRTVPAQAAVSNLVVFGDSLADVGNAGLATSGTFPPSGLYFQEPFSGVRFSGGPIWVDTLAEAVGAPLVGPSLLGGLDYAFGGAALSVDNPYLPVPKVGTQVGQYLATHQPAKDDLFAFWAGANDFFYGASSPVEPAQELANQVRTLAAAGARNFVVNELPPLGQTPYFQDQLEWNPYAAAMIAGSNAWAAGFNAVLADELAAVRADYHKVVIVTVDADGLFAEWARPGNTAGFIDWTHAAGEYDDSTGLLESPAVANHEEFLFYDSIHPGTRAHQLVGLHAAAGVLDALHVNHLTVTTTEDVINPLSGGRSLSEVLALAELMPGHQAVTFAHGGGAGAGRPDGTSVTVGAAPLNSVVPGAAAVGEGIGGVLHLAEAGIGPRPGSRARGIFVGTGWDDVFPG
jgi:phospholipase/lecithinase/hemolysin